jgi:hypothetical protein
MRWKAMGSGNACPACGHYSQIECDEFGGTREMCYTCMVPVGIRPPTQPPPEPPPTPPRVRPKGRWRSQGTDRQCAAGVSCRGTGMLERRRGRPRASGLCDPCAERAA